MALTRRLGDKVRACRRRPFVTNPAILNEGIEKGVGNSVLVKVNQIGTLSETLDTVGLAHKAVTAVLSHRSGEDERGHNYCPSCRCAQRRPDKDRRALPQRARSKI